MMTLSFLGVGRAIGPPRPTTPVALGWGVGVLGRGAAVVACRASADRLFCFCWEASVLVF